MPKSAMDTLIVTMRPHDAFATISSPKTILFTDSEEMANYTGRIVIHSGVYPSESAAEAGYSALEEAGWSKEDAPMNAFIGYCTIKANTTKLAEELSFQQTRDLHSMRDSTLKAMLKRLKWEQAWGLVLQDSHWAPESPVVDIKAESTEEETVLWFPDQPYQYEGIKLISNKERSLPFEEALDIVYPMATA